LSFHILVPIPNVQFVVLCVRWILIRFWIRISDLGLIYQKFMGIFLFNQLMQKVMNLYLLVICRVLLRCGILLQRFVFKFLGIPELQISHLQETNSIVGEPLDQLGSSWREKPQKKVKESFGTRVPLVNKFIPFAVMMICLFVLFSFKILKRYLQLLRDIVI